MSESKQEPSGKPRPDKHFGSTCMLFADCGKDGTCIQRLVGAEFDIKEFYSEEFRFGLQSLMDCSQDLPGTGSS